MKNLDELLTSLDSREKDILIARYVLRESLRDIGKSYGVSRERIRQIAQRTIDKILPMLGIDRDDWVRKHSYRPRKPHPYSLLRVVKWLGMIQRGRLYRQKEFASTVHWNYLESTMDDVVKTRKMFFDILLDCFGVPSDDYLRSCNFKITSREPFYDMLLDFDKRKFNRDIAIRKLEELKKKIR